jgi:curli biogenesis system outer membrane secretion channel CsgG
MKIQSLLVSSVNTLVLGVLAMGLQTGFGADKPAPSLPTISVAKSTAQNVAQWQPAMGEGLAQMIITELAKLDNMKVLESVALDDLREEQDLAKRGEVSKEEGVKVGGWKGADYTFKSVFVRFGAKEANYGGGGGVPFGLGGFSVRRSEHEVQIDWRIIDNASREIVKGASGSAVGLEKGGGFNFGSWSGHGFSGDRQFMDSALGKATVKAIAQIVAKVKTLQLAQGTRAVAAEAQATAKKSAARSVKGTVDLVDGKEIWVSLGTKNGFAKGDKIKIYKPVEKKNQAGKVVLTTYKEVAQIELLKVRADKSVGEYSGSEAISEGWIAADAALDIDALE